MIIPSTGPSVRLVVVIVIRPHVKLKDENMAIASIDTTETQVKTVRPEPSSTGCKSNSPLEFIPSVNDRPKNRLFAEAARRDILMTERQMPKTKDS
tara:strand:+ start:485 stop:772 length:288 start_codon:yes stop_codon:yes gene_type:complete